MKRTTLYLLLVAAAMAQLWSCASDQLDGTPLENQPPQVWLSSAPPEGDVASYTIKLFWGGSDPDGEIAFYEYAITDNKGNIFNPADTIGAWEPVVGNDSTFTFTADELADSSVIDEGEHHPEEFRRSHTFFIRAVDDRGKRSGAEYRSFTSRTLSPTVIVNVPPSTGFNSAQVPPITTFQWTGKDYVSTLQQVQEPESVRTILVSNKKFGGKWDDTMNYIQMNPDAVEWSDWEYYRQPGDTGQFWTSPPLDLGEYLFGVQVMDEAGAVNPVFDLQNNIRRILVSQRSTGPSFRVFNQFLGTIQTASKNTPASILDLPVNVPMTFTLEASAESYGGIVSGYRYGWDILDLNDDEQWEIDFTPFSGTQAKTPPRTFTFGTHVFNADVIDNSGFISRVTVVINIIPFTMGRALLLIDDWDEGTTSGFTRTNGGVPNDIEHDAFWRDMLSDIVDFNEDQDVKDLGVAGADLQITDIADYQNIIWYAPGSYNSTSQAFLSRVIRFIDPTLPASGGKSTPNLAALFMSAGGHVLLCGNQLMTMTINRESFLGPAPTYPLIFRYELGGDQDGAYEDSDIGERGVGDDSFSYAECCLNIMDVAVIAVPGQVRRPPNQNFSPGTGCPVHLIRDHGQNIGTGQRDGLRVASPIDLAFPRLELRAEVAGRDTVLADSTLFFWVGNSGLNVDLYNPSYFSDMTPCDGVAETDPPRDCFEPIWGMECTNQSSVIFGAPVAFWTGVFKERVPDNGGGVAARSAIWGFHPVYFKPDQVKAALNVIFDEWNVPRN